VRSFLLSSRGKKLLAHTSWKIAMVANGMIKPHSIEEGMTDDSAIF
jgi:hypothetical protein